MFQIIDENEDIKQEKELADKITPEMLGLKPTNDYDAYMQQQVIDEDSDKAEKWSKKGAIGIVEAGLRYGAEFNGTYNNIDNNVGLNPLENKLKNSRISQRRSDSVDERIAENKKKQEERKARINNGTANLFDKIFNVIDNIGNDSYNAQVQYAKQNEDIQKPHKNDSNYRYEASGSLSGNVVYNEIDLRKKVGFLEGLTNGIESGEAIPFMGGKVTGDRDKKLRDIGRRIKNNESIRQDELDYFNKNVEDEQEKMIRGYSIGGEIGEGVLPSIFAFGGEIALGGAVMGRLGLSGAGTKAGYNIGKFLIKHNKMGKVGKTIAKGVAFAGGQLAEGAINAGVTSVVNPQRIYATFEERRLNDEIKITDFGTVVFSEASETPAKALLKSLGGVYVSYFSECTGGLIGGALINPIKKGTGALANAGAKQFVNVMENNPVLNKMIKKTAPILARAYEKINNLPLKGESVEWLRSKVKFDGFLEECGEEVLEDVLNLAIGTNNEERSFENYLKAITKSPEEWAVIAGTIALQGGAISLTGNLLGGVMERNGSSPEDIQNVLTTSTENEQRELIDESIQSGILNIPDDAISKTKDVEITAEIIADRFRKSNKYDNEENVEKHSRLFANILTQIADKNGRDIDEVVANYLPSVEQVNGYEFRDENGNGVTSAQIKKKLEETFKEFDSLPADYDNQEHIESLLKDINILDGMTNGELSEADSERAFELLENEINNNGALSQSAYHGTPHNFDEFSTENIGTGEGTEITKTPQFKKWFGDSKVVDDKGEPLKLKDNDNVYIVDGLSNSGISKYTYKGGHRAPSYSEGDVQDRIENSDDVNLLEVAQGQHNQPADYFDTIGARYYGYDDVEGQESATAVRSVQRAIKSGKKNITVTVYRAIPSDVKNTNLKNGDWITLSKTYAKVHGETNLDDNYKIIEDEVPTENVWWDGNDIREWGYDNGQGSESDLYLSIQNPAYLDKIPSSWKEARKLRDEGGYDGVITPDGKYLVLEKTQIKSIYNQGTFDSENPNIYYQSEVPKNIVDLTDDFQKTPTIDEVKEYINKIVESGTKFATLSPDWFVDVKKENSNRKQKRITDKIVNNGNYQKLSKQEKNRHNKYIMSLEKLLNNAQYLGEKENTKKDKKPNIEKYHYFKTNVKVGNKTYEIIFDTEEYKNEKSSLSDYEYSRSLKEPKEDTNSITDNENNFNPEEYKNESSSSANVLRSVKNLKEDSNDSINDNKTNFNPKTVHLYNIKEIKKPNTKQYQDEDSIQTNMLYDNVSPRKLQKVRGGYIPAERFIELFKNADESTIIHETAHWWLDVLQDSANYNNELGEDLEEVRKFLKNNGEDFTVEQQEKFARAFEAYIRNGSAKNNKLKKIFEDFKNFLLSIYDNILQLGYKPEDMPEIQNLFDRLLTTEMERIQSKVFDKCNAIDEKIKKIKENQVKELNALDEIYKNNIEANNIKSDKKRKVEEYLELAETAVSREPKELREYKKRYKDATLSILETATGYKRQFIANPKNWEKVQLAIENVDDKITASGGMHGEWVEFYPDTGVSYDNDEVDGDYNLAQKAFDTLISGDYSFGKDIGNDDINRFYGKFDYLVNKINTLKGEEKATALEALYGLFKDMPEMPNEVASEIVDKIPDVEQKYEEQQKNDFNRKSYPNIPVVQQLQMFITMKIKDLKVYDPEAKYRVHINKSHRLYQLIKNAVSVNAAKEIVRKINNYVIEDLENQEKGLLHKEVQKQIKTNSKVARVGNMKHGKFDWKTNTVFSELAKMNRLTQAEALAEYNKLANTDEAYKGEERDDVDTDTSKTLSKPTDFEQIIKQKFIEYKAMTGRGSDGKRGGRISDLNTAQVRSLLEDILELKAVGRSAKNEEELKKKLNKYDYENDLIQILENNKNNGMAKYIARFISGDTLLSSEGTLANWESLLNTLFNRETAQKYSLLQDEANAEIYAHNVCKKFYDRAMEIYNLKKPINNVIDNAKHLFKRMLDFDNTQPLIDLFQGYDNEIYTYKQNTYNRETGKYVETNIDLSKSQIITLYAWSLNPQLEQRLYTQFGPKLNDILSHLSNADKEFAWLMVDTCDSMYEDSNEVFIRTSGLSLPRVENYIPSKTERICSDIDMLQEGIVRANNPSFIKERKVCNRIKMDSQNPFGILFPHINKTARYIVLSEKLNFYNKIFKSPDLKAKIIDVYGKKSGEKIHRMLINQLACSTFENYAKSISVGKSIMDTIASNYITSRIGGNLKVAFGQLTSVINYAENMPSHQWAIGFAKALAKPEETIKFMFNNCEYLSARLAGNSQNEVITKLTSESDRFRSLRNFCTANTKYGDILALIFGGKPYVDYLINQGMSKEEAFKKYTEDTLRSQQSGHNSATSIWQKKQADNPLSRMFFAFNNTNLQYERKWIDSLSNYSKGEIRKDEFLKSFVIYKIFNPILFTSILSNLSLLQFINAITGGGGDDALKNLGISSGTAVILSNLKAYGWLGFVANSILSIGIAFATDDLFFKTDVPFLSDIEDVANKLFRKGSKGTLKFEDYVDMSASVADYISGVPATRLTNFAGGIGDIAQGDNAIGLLRMLGYGKYRSTMAITNEAPKKKKR